MSLEGITILGLIFCCGFGISHFLIFRNDKSNYCQINGIGFYISLIIFMVFLCIITICIENEPNYKYETYEYKLIALKNKTESDSSIHGSFFLGCGSINGNTDNYQYYYYMYETINGIKFEKSNLNNNDTYIKIINDDEIPYIEYTYKGNSTPMVFTKLMLSEKYYSRYKLYFEKITFYIPENSIDYSIKIGIDNF